MRGVWRGRPDPEVAQQDAPVIDPRLAYTGPFRNVHPDVQYSGNGACIDCHRDIALSFARHPMGRSMAPAEVMLDRQRYDEDVHNPFEAHGRRFLIERDGRHLRHRQLALAGGKVLYEQDHEVSWVVGSGTHGYSYLREKEGYVFQTPISWFTQKGFWDLSPGFSPDQCSGRPIMAGCLFCHSNRVHEVPGEEQRFVQPVFEGHASIGCERCHGPGQVHVAERDRLDAVLGKVDTSIVNPRHLDPGLRDSVCEQCHLQGVVKLVRRGRGQFDFRPGLSLGQFLAVFVKAEGPGEINKAVNHVEQMRQSKCYLGSSGKGKLGCISCHNPHEKPTPAAREAWFRQRCLACHQQRGCAVHLVERTRTTPGDSCIDCHMKRSQTADIVHAALTDHRILRQPRDQGGLPPRRGQTGEGSHLPIASFYGGSMGPGEEEANRDLGVALLRGVTMGRLMPEQVLSRGVSLLEPAALRAPRDVDVQVALGDAYLLQQRRADSRVHFQAALSLSPKRQRALAQLANLAAADRRYDEAVGYSERLMATNPYFPAHRHNLALLLSQAGRWGEAERQARQAVKLDPSGAALRQMLVLSLVRQGRQKEANSEFEVLRRLQPSNLAQLETWFARELRRRP
jgi:hypothetical protein